MLDFMDYVQAAFAEASGWPRDHSYTTLTDSSKAILDFSTPERLRIHLSSLSTPQFATTYSLGTVGVVDGSVSYLYSSLPLNSTVSRSALVPLRQLVPGYRQVSPPTGPLDTGLAWTFGNSQVNGKGDSDSLNGLGEGTDVIPAKEKKKATLLHATLYLPSPTTLTALFLHRPSPTTKLSVALWSSRAAFAAKSAPPQSSVLTQLCHDTGKYSSEFLFSSDNALLGFRGLWNFGPDPRTQQRDSANTQGPHPVSLLSAGGEAYYSPLSHVIGFSTGLRFTTLPAASKAASTLNAPSPISAFPYTLTLTITPLSGSLSTTYSLLASPNLAFSSRFGFNVYSWESEMVAGCELWRGRSGSNNIPAGSTDDDLTWARRKMGLLPTDPVIPSPHAEKEGVFSKIRNEDEKTATESVIKVRVDQSYNLRLLWEGRMKELLVSAGVALGPVSPAPAAGLSTPTKSGYGWTGVGVSVLYSS